MSDITGKIWEFGEKSIRIMLENPEQPATRYVLTVAPSTVDSVFNVRNGKSCYCATGAQAKQHILDAIKLARMSVYAGNHVLTLEIPFYPNIIVSVPELDKVIPTLTNALDNCF